MTHFWAWLNRWPIVKFLKTQESTIYKEITMMNIHAVQSETSWATSPPPSPSHLLGLLATELYPGQLENLG